MNSGFKNGLIVGSIIGASVGAMSNSGMMNSRNKRKIMRSGRTMLRRTGNVVSDIMDVFR